MAKTQYTQEQIIQLLKNPHVNKCSKTSISYSPDFKVPAVKEYYEEGNSPNMIFQKAGFDLRVIGRGKPKTCMKLWRAIYKANGSSGLLHEHRGRTKKTIASRDTEDLQARIAYLEEENDFLRHLKTKTKN